MPAPKASFLQAQGAGYVQGKAIRSHSDSIRKKVTPPSITVAIIKCTRNTRVIMQMIERHVTKACSARGEKQKIEVDDTCKKRRMRQENIKPGRSDR